MKDLSGQRSESNQQRWPLYDSEMSCFRNNEGPDIKLVDRRFKIAIVSEVSSFSTCDFAVVDVLFGLLPDSCTNNQRAESFIS